MDAEHFIKVRAGAVDASEVEVVDHHGQGELPEIISVQFDFLDAFPQLADLGLPRIVQKDIVRRRVVEIDLAEKRTLGVMEMPTLHLDGTAGSARIFLL